MFFISFLEWGRIGHHPWGPLYEALVQLVLPMALASVPAALVAARLAPNRPMTCAVLFLGPILGVMGVLAPLGGATVTALKIFVMLCLSVVAVFILLSGTMRRLTWRWRRTPATPAPLS